MHGEVAITKQSKELESSTRYILDKLGVTRLDNFVSRYTSKDLKRLLSLSDSIALGGVLPDGGIIVDNMGKPICAIECKYNNETGNAVERWFKNYCVLKALGVKRYVTLTMGNGFCDNNSPLRALSHIYYLENMTGDSIFDDKTKTTVFYHFKDSEELCEKLESILREELCSIIPLESELRNVV